MDQLDILKENWKSQDENYPKYSKENLLSMIAKKSTSIVKWLLIIAIIEFFVTTGIGVLYHILGTPDETTRNLMESDMMKVVNIVHYIVVIYFIYLFYRNYKNISVIQPTRSLMKNIIHTRRTMKWYIWYNLIAGFVVGMMGTTYILNNDTNISQLLVKEPFLGNETYFYLIAFLFMIIFYAFFLGLIYLIYMLIYGILLKRLKKNYEELKRMEV